MTKQHHRYCRHTGLARLWLRVPLLSISLAILAGCSMQTVRAMQEARLAGTYADSVGNLLQAKADTAGGSGDLGTAVLRIEVRRDGGIEGVSVLQSSGDPALDQQATAIVTGMDNLPAPPKGVSPDAEQVELIIPVSLLASPWPAEHTTHPALVPIAVPKVSQYQIMTWQSAYLAAIQTKIARNFRYPERARLAGEEGTARIKVTMLPDGTLLGAALQRPSGHVLLDAEALMVYGRIGRLPPVPYPLPPQIRTVTFELPVQFQLK